jgi:hypothetical protein
MTLHEDGSKAVAAAIGDMRADGRLRLEHPALASQVG